MIFNVGNTIEFERKGSKMRGNILRVENDCIYINIFAGCYENQWRYMGVFSEIPMPISQIENPIIVNGIGE
ncbi:hypothetical protein D3C71_1835460 [compost metagenome]